MNKKEVFDFLNANPVSHLATIEGSAPRVRALGILKADEDGILFQTWKSKDLGSQLNQNSEVELCFNNYEKRMQIRVRGRVELNKSAAAREKVLAERPQFQKHLDGGQEFAIYNLRNGLAHIWTFEKNFEPKTFISL
ncbi:pyridoxamine 5'-phosphate oxidase family protein [Chloroflexota bacterium]